MSIINTDTIVARATPRGTGAIAIVRVSGDKVTQIIEKLHDKGEAAVSDPRKLVLGNIIGKNNEVIDEGMVAYMPSPNSYTGEDVGEIHLHGNDLIVEKTIKTVRELGARLAEPGEFTKRAFLNDKMDLSRAEGINASIVAQSEAALRIAESNLHGGLARNVRDLKNELTEIHATVSAGLDFAEEDIDLIKDSELYKTLRDARDKVIDWLKDSKTAAYSKNGFTVAIIGPPNAGKSTLLNEISGEDRAIVTDIAGTTRDILEVTLTLDGVPVRLIDTAGIRDAQDEIERIGVRRSRQAFRSADLILVAIPATSKSSFDEDLSYLKRPVIGVQTMIDLSEKRVQWPEYIRDVVRTSAKTREGLDKLKKSIARELIDNEALEDAITANERHIASLEKTQNELNEALVGLENNIPQDVVVTNITAAIEALNEITGENVSDDVINKIFSSFCIGK